MNNKAVAYLVPTEPNKCVCPFPSMQYANIRNKSGIAEVNLAPICLSIRASPCVKETY